MKKKQYVKRIIAGASVVMLGVTGSPAMVQNVVKADSRPSSSLTLTSSSDYLQSAFNWAKEMALSKVSKDGKFPCYQAALQWRKAFCQRDFAHQIDGAALLGMNSENYYMLQELAKKQSADRNWYGYWEMGFDGSEYQDDLEKDGNGNYTGRYWRNACGMFECVEGGYRQYQWTGNRNLLNNSYLSNYYAKTTKEFVECNDEDGNGILEEHAVNGFGAVCTYNEKSDTIYREAADGVATQYAAYKAYSDILAARGEMESNVNVWNNKANALKNTFNSSSWYDASQGRFLRGKIEDSRLTEAKKRDTSFGYEASWFPLYKEMITDNSKAARHLDFVYNSFKANPSTNIEAWTYLPDTYYKWQQKERAYEFLSHIIDSQSDYPEVSFTIISAIATGMMGIQPDAAKDKVATLPMLPGDEYSPVANVDLNHVKIGSHDVEVKHEGNQKTTVKHNSGDRTLTWDAQFAGSYQNLYVNGTQVPAQTKTVNGKPVSYVTVSLSQGQSSVVTTSQNPQIPKQEDTRNLVKNPGFENNTSGWNFTEGTGVSDYYPHSGAGRAFLDQGTSNKVSQNVTVKKTGYYNVSAWVAGFGGGSTVGLKVNGYNRLSIPVTTSQEYKFYEQKGILLNANDQVEIYVSGSPEGWVNVDDVALRETP